MKLEWEKLSKQGSVSSLQDGLVGNFGNTGSNDWILAPQFLITTRTSQAVRVESSKSVDVFLASIHQRSKLDTRETLTGWTDLEGSSAKIWWRSRGHPWPRKKEICGSTAMFKALWTSGCWSFAPVCLNTIPSWTLAMVRTKNTRSN
jgi:hypothetical protein